MQDLWDEPGLKGVFKRFSTLYYLVFNDKFEIIGHVGYNGTSQTITIKLAETIETRHRWFKPDEFEYNNITYFIYEKLNGTVVITKKNENESNISNQTYKEDSVEESIVAEGKYGFTTVEFNNYTEEIKDILKFLGVGYCIKGTLLRMLLI